MIPFRMSAKRRIKVKDLSVFVSSGHVLRMVVGPGTFEVMDGGGARGGVQSV